jgi:hypothetical protein
MNVSVVVPTYNRAHSPALLVWHQIPAERMRPAYFRLFSFDSAEGEARLLPPPSQRHFLGAFYFDYRWAVSRLTSWAVAIAYRRPDAFDRELEFLQAVGRLWARWKRHLARRHQERP